jgi:hypothetical protein
MIADSRSNGIAVQSTMSGDKIGMTVDLSNMGHIMSILTDLYSDRELAVLREYATNALDAHREVGQTRPIEVTLPKPNGLSADANFLRIRDFGVGLTVDDIHNIYSKYGSSTKRATNDQVGMLGLGCKSALTYTQQFTVVSVKDGTKVAVLVGREDDGSGSMTILDTSATDEADGTEIVVPTLRDNRFGMKAEALFRFWEPGTVLVDGKQPRSIRESAMKVTDNIIVCKEGEIAENYVVMGNVPYPTKISGREGLPINLPHGHYIVAFVPIGAVNFAPSREALMDTQTSKDTMLSIKAEYEQGIVGVVERAVRSAKSHHEALAARLEWSAFIQSGSTITYKGEAIPTELKHPHADLPWDQKPNDPKGTDRPFEATSHYYKIKTNSEWRIRAEGWAHRLWITGWDYAKLSRTQAAKIDKYLTDNGLDCIGPYNRKPSVVLWPGKYPHTKWLDPRMVVEWSTIEAVKLPKAANGTVFAGQRKTGSFDCFVDGVWRSEVDANDIDLKKPVYYYAGPSAQQRTSQEARLFDSIGHDCTIVTMPSNRRDKFCREFSAAIPLSDALMTAYKGWTAKLDADTKMALALADAHLTDTMRSIDPMKVDDPKLKRAARIAGKTTLTKVIEQRKMFERVLPYGTVKKDTVADNPLSKYPLFDTYALRNAADHTYWYLNAAFAAI